MIARLCFRRWKGRNRLRMFYLRLRPRKSCNRLAFYLRRARSAAANRRHARPNNADRMIHNAIVFDRA